MVSSTEDILQNNRSDPSARLVGVVVRSTRDSTPVILNGSISDRLFGRILFGILVAWLLLVAFGCGGSGAGGTLTPLSGIESGVVLEWDDLDSAVNYVAANDELALIEAETVRIGGGSGVIRRYRLIDANDHPIEIRFTTESEAIDGLQAASISRDGSVVVRVGRFGDDQRERAIVSALLDRLGVLAVVD